RWLALWLAGDPGPRLAARNAGPDVLARGRSAVVAPSGRPSAYDAVARPRASRGEALARLGHPRWRPAGAVGLSRLLAPCRSRAEPAGGDRRARVSHRPPDLFLLPTRVRAAVARPGALVLQA